MSDEPKRGPRRWGCLALVLAPLGGIVGYIVGVNYFCPPGAGIDCGVLAVFVGMPIGLALGFVAYIVVRAISFLR
jgi:hypothetical protein